MPLHGKLYSLEDLQLASKLKALNLDECVKLLPTRNGGIYANWPKNRGIFIGDDSR